MKLLVGLYRPQEGKILYNGIDENSINFDDLRNQIGFVTQDTQLFSRHHQRKSDVCKPVSYRR